jgi:hypothetical protein
MAAEDGHARRHGPVQIMADGQQGADHDALVEVRRGQQGDDKGDQGTMPSGGWPSRYA